MRTLKKTLVKQCLEMLVLSAAAVLFETATKENDTEFGNNEKAASDRGPSDSDADQASWNESGALLFRSMDWTGLG
eukprot:7786299-Heterocapsa_arctica.AAC.1